MFSLSKEDGKNTEKIKFITVHDTTSSHTQISCSLKDNEG